MEESDWHVKTGFIGLGFLFRVLKMHNYNDIAYRLITNETFPSWGFMIKHGATTLWERWDSYTPEKGFYEPTMNSFNHCSLGVIGEWIFSSIGGIDMINSENTDFLINPFPYGNLKYAQATFESHKGNVFVKWELGNNFFYLNLSIPANTTAEVLIPKKAINNIHESCKSIKTSTEIEIIKIDEYYLRLKISSGEYTFKLCADIYF